MLTVSTSHICAETAQRLQTDLLPRVYPKGEYGWFVYIPPDKHEVLDGDPADLAGLIAFARTHDCEWLCIDTDGPEAPMVPTYEW